MSLDSRRLGKQRLETTWILEALRDPRSPRHKYPATLMWRGFTDALVAYGVVICDEWIARGCADNERDKILAYRTTPHIPTQETVPMPSWLGRESFHASHRGNLLRKDYDYYKVFGWTDSPLLPYEWPVNDDPRLFRFQR